MAENDKRVLRIPPPPPRYMGFVIGEPQDLSQSRPKFYTIVLIYIHDVLHAITA